MEKALRIIVAGGGIGGLTAAVALSQRGHSVQVLERAPELRAVGAGITIQLNASRALAKLGLEARLTAAGAIIGRGRLLDWNGKVISELDLAPLSRQLGVSCVAIHRAELQALLVEALGTASLRLGAEVKGFTQDAQSVSVSLADGSRLEADVLIGADGLRSSVRAQLHGDAPPDYAGYTCWRGVCENGGISDPGATSETWGAGKRFGLVPLGAGKLYWFAVADAPAGGTDGPEVKAEVQARFAGWHTEVVRALEATAQGDIFRADITNRPNLPSWGEGRVTLVGDAAHPMTPNLGQGACMAIEDGVVLARALSEQAEVGAGLRAYEALRIERTRSTVAMARKMGRVGQWSNGLARALRNTAVRATPRSVSDRQLHWLYAYEA